MEVWIVTISGVFYGVFTDYLSAEKSITQTYKNQRNGATVIYTGVAPQITATASNGDVLLMSAYLPDSLPRILQGF